ncbi:MAG: cellulose biosynthesis cyclic di-GMP-binding regulatory protein BcsB [Cyanobacteria bacterium J06638_20]
MHSFLRFFPLFRRVSRWLSFCLDACWRRRLVLGSLTCLLGIGLHYGLAIPAQAQVDSLENREDQLIEQFTPTPITTPNPANRPVYQPRPSQAPATPPSRPAEPRPQAPAAQPPTTTPSEPTPATETASAATDEPFVSQYILEFNRSPVVGLRFRLEGRMDEARLGFTRPSHWRVQTAKAMIRFQHSPNLVGDRSSMTVRVNGTSIGSIPLNRSDVEIGQVLFNIPPNLIQDFNEISMLVQQAGAEDCPAVDDPNLWTEILPDSKLLFDFTTQPIALDFARYPYPILDPLGLDAEQLAYLQPATLTDEWLTAAAKLHASFGRIKRFQPTQTRLVESVADLEPNERLIVIGTPAEQTALASLMDPVPVKDGQVLDANELPLAGETGLLLLTTTGNNENPVLVATGNTPAGVSKAVQFLAQGPDRELGAGQIVTVTQSSEVGSPPPRQWSRYLPSDRNTFALTDLQRADGRFYEDVTVRGAMPPPIDIDFRLLPDEQLLSGSTMILDYSYSPQINPREASVEVQLDGLALVGEPLRSIQGGQDQLRVELPPGEVHPDSRLRVQFTLPPRQQIGTCEAALDRQMWATVHAAKTQFRLRRETITSLPDLKLLRAGYPLSAPQDLSTTALTVPDDPSSGELLTLLQVSERLGRLTDSSAVKLETYRQSTLPQPIREGKNIVAIGRRDRFPLPEVFGTDGLAIGDLFARQQGQTQIQTLPDTEGILRSVISPWNTNRVLLGLTAQSDEGLAQVRDLFHYDRLFFQLEGETALVSRNTDNPTPYDPHAYTLKFLHPTQSVQIGRRSPLRMATHFFQQHWLLLPSGIVVSALLLFGATQFYLNQFSNPGDDA